MAGFYASSDCGAVFLPEIGDEVILGYLNDDPANAVILGSAYSPKRKPAVPFDRENDIKAILTRTKLSLTFDEAAKAITLATPAGNKVVLSDEAKSIEMQDEAGNTVELSPSGIRLSSPSDIAIDAKGKISITAAGDMTVEGLNVRQSAMMEFSAEGSASAELQSSGETAVKGALVKIN